ncbi:hypothetical protein KDW24_29525 [Burkholderia cenocepacia]|nr:hypothetical protein [Burkholderia cenocepacia]
MIEDLRSKKVFLILDKLREFRVKLIKVWLTEHVGQIGVFYLQLCSLELSPLRERLNAYLKASVTKQAPTRIKWHLTKVAACHLPRHKDWLQGIVPYFVHNPIRNTIRFNFIYFGLVFWVKVLSVVALLYLPAMVSSSGSPWWAW